MIKPSPQNWHNVSQNFMYYSTNRLINSRSTDSYIYIEMVCLDMILSPIIGKYSWLWAAWCFRYAWLSQLNSEGLKKTPIMCNIVKINPPSLFSHLVIDCWPINTGSRSFYDAEKKFCFIGWTHWLQQ